MLSANQLRQKYLDFFKSKGHIIIPSASLVPENDPTTLFTGSGMQPMVSYLLGEKHPLGTRLVDAQKCFRTQDIEEVGDNRHTTMFEMLGNWSLGDYFKKEQISWMFEFLIKEIGLNPENLYISVFRGLEKKGIARDTEAAELWQKQFAQVNIEAKIVDLAEINGLQGGRIFYYDETKNWWSRAGVTDNMPVGEPGGPDSEMFWDFGADLKIHENSEFKDQPCHINCDCGRFVEIGNNVFMTYLKTDKGFVPLKKGNIDFGGGLERMAAASYNTPDIFLTDLFTPIINKIEEISGKKYAESEATKRSFRIIADHLKASTFLIADGVLPSNTERGYFLRRVIRRAVRYGKNIGLHKSFTAKIAEVVIKEYEKAYPELKKNRDLIIEQLSGEEEKFAKALKDGLAQAKKIIDKKVPITEEKFNIIMQNKDKGEILGRAMKDIREGVDTKAYKEFNVPITQKEIKDALITGKEAFDMFQSFGFPREMMLELAQDNRLFVDTVEFRNEVAKHQELSKTASAGMFKGGLADTGEMSIKYHTATHLLLAALRELLSPDIYQKGSNITAERLRFDFNYPQKLTAEQIKAVENLVNQKISEKIPVELMEMPKADALKIAKVSFDPAKYGDMVKVYKIDNFSIELCGGPHVANTGDLGHFKIVKEEASSAGVRRIKAILE